MNVDSLVAPTWAAGCSTNTAWSLSRVASVMSKSPRGAATLAINARTTETDDSTCCPSNARMAISRSMVKRLNFAWRMRENSLCETPVRASAWRVDSRSASRMCMICVPGSALACRTPATTTPGQAVTVYPSR